MHNISIIIREVVGRRKSVVYRNILSSLTLLSFYMKKISLSSLVEQYAKTTWFNQWVTKLCLRITSNQKQLHDFNNNKFKIIKLNFTKIVSNYAPVSPLV